MNFRHLSVWMLLLCPALAVAAPELRNGIAAIVNQSVITFEQVDQITSQEVELLHRTLANQPEIYRQRRLATMQDGLEVLVQRRLILDEFKTSGFQFPESLIDDDIKQKIRERFGDRATLTKSLQAEGISFETFRKRMWDDTVVYIMEQKFVRSIVLISPAKIENYYATNLAKFKLQDQVKLRMIQLARPPSTPVKEIRDRAQEILRKLDEGVPFAEMASIYSEDAQRKDGGDRGWVDDKKFNKGLTEVIFSLNSGQHSGVLGFARDGTNGFWLYRYGTNGLMSLARKFTGNDEFVEEKKFDVDPGAANELPPPMEFYIVQADDRRGAHTRPLPEVREEIEKELLVQEHGRIRRAWLQKLRTKSFIRYFYF